MEELGLIVNMGLALAAALVGGMIVRLLKQPVILGYILVGIAIGPFGLKLIPDQEQVQALATIGVILLLFALGLEFSLSELRRIGKIAIFGGMIQILTTIGLGVGVASLLGWPLSEAIGFGFIIASSSTVVVLKILMERREVDSVHGRIMIGFLIVQDFAVVPMVIFLPTLGETGNLLPALGIATLKAGLFLGVVLLLGIWVLPWLLKRIAGMRSRELFFLFIITLSLGAAYGAHLFGLSPAIGAFVAGLLISRSEFAYQALGNVTSLRDLFATLFFVSIGMLIAPRFVVENLSTLAIIVSAIVLGKLIIFPVITLLFGYLGKMALFVGAGMIQISEFSFILAMAGVEAGVISDYVYSLVVASAIITMLLTPFSLNLASPLYPRLRKVKGMRRFMAGGPAPSLAGKEAQLSGHAVICGYGGVARNLGHVLEQRGFSYFVIDIDPRVISSARNRGIPCVFGDASSLEVLAQAKLEKAKVLVVAFPDPIAARLTVENARSINRRLDVVARVHHDEDSEVLRGLGVAEQVRPELEAGLEIIRHTLHRFGLSTQEIQFIINHLREEGSTRQ